MAENMFCQNTETLPFLSVHAWVPVNIFSANRRTDNLKTCPEAHNKTQEDDLAAGLIILIHYIDNIVYADVCFSRFNMENMTLHLSIGYSKHYLCTACV